MHYEEAGNRRPGNPKVRFQSSLVGPGSDNERFHHWGPLEFPDSFILVGSGRVQLQSLPTALGMKTSVHALFNKDTFGFYFGMGLVPFLNMGSELKPPVHNRASWLPSSSSPEQDLSRTALTGVKQPFVPITPPLPPLSEVGAVLSPTDRGRI